MTESTEYQPPSEPTDREPETSTNSVNNSPPRAVEFKTKRNFKRLNCFLIFAYVVLFIVAIIIEARANHSTVPIISVETVDNNGELEPKVVQNGEFPVFVMPMLVLGFSLLTHFACYWWDEDSAYGHMGFNSQLVHQLPVFYLANFMVTQWMLVFTVLTISGQFSLGTLAFCSLFVFGAALFRFGLHWLFAIVFDGKHNEHFTRGIRLLLAITPCVFEFVSWMAVWVTVGQNKPLLEDNTRLTIAFASLFVITDMGLFIGNMYKELTSSNKITGVQQVVLFLLRLTVCAGTVRGMDKEFWPSFFP